MSKARRKWMHGAALWLLMAAMAGWCWAQAPPPEGGDLNPSQLQQLTAPIALYPDPLVAQILAAATYPSQIVEADRWLQANQTGNSAALALQVNQQNWDPSVMALTEYPSVLANLDQNLAWTSALGDAYYNQPDDVMAAIQTLRQLALNAGTLRSGPQLQVTASGGIISIEPAAPAIVYVPSYDAWMNYGPAITPWPGYFLPAGVGARAGLFFGVGINLGAFEHYGWGWQGWGSDWHNRQIVYNNQPYVSQSPTFYNRGRTAAPAPLPSRPGGRSPARPVPISPSSSRSINPSASRSATPSTAPRGRATAAKGGAAAPGPDVRAVRGFTPQPSPAAGVSTSAFSGIDHGRQTATNAARGQASLHAPAAAARPTARAPSPATPPARRPAASAPRGRR